MARFLGHQASVVLLCAVLWACVAPGPPMVAAHVVRFPDLAGPLAGASFAVVPLEHQAASAEFNQYRREIAGFLEGQGMAPAADEADADYLVTLDYGLGSRDETELVEDYGIIVPSRWITVTESRYNVATGLYEPYQSTEFVPAVTGVTGYHAETVTVYDRRFVLRLFDRARSTPEALYPAYEGWVTSSGSTPSFAAVSTCLFRMLFVNFTLAGTEDLALESATCMR